MNDNSGVDKTKCSEVGTRIRDILLGSGLSPHEISVVAEANMVALAGMFLDGNADLKDRILGGMVYDMLLTHNRTRGDLHPDACMHERMSLFFMDAILHASDCEANRGADTDDVITSIITTVARYLDACARERNEDLEDFTATFCDTLMEAVSGDDDDDPETEKGEEPDPSPTLN